MSRLDGRVAIVTGGARGIGEAIVRSLHSQGARVVIADRLRDEGQRLADALGECAIFVTLDVTREADWQNLVEIAHHQWGRIDILVNNAGVLIWGDIASTTGEAFDQVMAVNVKGALLGIRHVGGVMADAGSGAIVNISSIDGLRGSNGVAAYVTSKWALRGLTRAAALEYGHRGVRVNSVHPGGIDTAMGNPTGLDPADLNRGYGLVPAQRAGRPPEVAEACLFLCGDGASYVNGAELAVDGGWSAGHYHTMLPGAPAVAQHG